MIYPQRKSTDLIVIHCTVTPEGKDLSAKDIDKMHRKQGLNGVGFHFIVRLNGTVELGRPVQAVGAHVQGLNGTSIGIAYVGGTDKEGRAKDTRTEPQKVALRAIVERVAKGYPNATVTGHRDCTRGFGRADPFLRLPESPCFDAVSEFADL